MKVFKIKKNKKIKYLKTFYYCTFNLLVLGQYTKVIDDGNYLKEKQKQHQHKTYTENKLHTKIILIELLFNYYKLI